MKGRENTLPRLYNLNRNFMRSGRKIKDNLNKKIREDLGKPTVPL